MSPCRSFGSGQFSVLIVFSQLRNHREAVVYCAHPGPHLRIKWPSRWQGIWVKGKRRKPSPLDAPRVHLTASYWRPCGGWTSKESSVGAGETADPIGVPRKPKNDSDAQEDGGEVNWSECTSAIWVAVGSRQRWVSLGSNWIMPWKTPFNLRRVTGMMTTTQHRGMQGPALLGVEAAIEAAGAKDVIGMVAGTNGVEWPWAACWVLQLQYVAISYRGMWHCNFWVACMATVLETFCWKSKQVWVRSSPAQVSQMPAFVVAKKPCNSLSTLANGWQKELKPILCWDCFGEVLGVFNETSSIRLLENSTRSGQIQSYNQRLSSL